ncbi:conserved hypothetical protein [Novosphingobium aromaticivorans DSM 12444]|uniref:Uncharacterized protein n=1 Tax=Novosphingobium aromaticivorans (strain ATCC 700278 / DSM 12444 / CCUG 56034 / CIP 105152 / NBRC 16084 / F199) TaxID=279238 RepID=Q2GBW9_NOVAD|nr:hypothetical protein [Novosphingobium aromaticivorans]ABD24654.1 conserved hypothetical protein [Novosphingobium aromaticivorans DSM 12444]SCY21596.1 hypothetical protein SAMN05660666_01064 [Novosphingobium aromaticivorans]
MLARMTPERRQYTRAVMLLMGGYAATLVGVNLIFEASRPTGISAYAAALLPALPVIGVFVVIGRLLASLRDEYQRYLLTRQVLIATAFMLSVATAWGFVESFGLLPHVPAFYAAVLWFAGLGLGGCVNAVLERSGGAE